MINANDLNKLVPISTVCHKTSQVINQLEKEKRMFIMKNNVPSAVLLSLEEFARLDEAAENYFLLMMAQQRVDAAKKNHEELIPFENVLDSEGLTTEDLDQMPEVDFE